MLDASPYFVDLSSNGTLSAYAMDLYRTDVDGRPLPPKVLYDTSEPHTLSFAESPQPTPGQMYDREGSLQFSLTPGSGADDASAGATLEGFFYHTDERESIGQPEKAHLSLTADVYASAAFTYDFRGNPLRSEGTSRARLENSTVASFLIWDEDCPTIGEPVEGNWEMNFRALAGEAFGSDAPGSGRLEVGVVVRYWRADEVDQPLVLDETFTMSIAVDAGYDEGNLGHDFELTVGSMIEIEITGVASANSDGNATLAELLFDLTIDPPKRLEIQEFTHYQDRVGNVDPRWMVVEYEILRPICYFDLEFDSVAVDSSTIRFDRFRIDATTLMNSERYQVLNPVTRAPLTPEEALDIGTHWLLVDGNDSDWMSAFTSLNNELIVVQEPQQEAYREEFHGFFHPVSGTPLVIRSDADNEDSIVLDGFTAEFEWNGETDSLVFAEGNPTVSTATEIIVVTSGENDMVIAAPDFTLPIQARLGVGDDIFLGGMRGDRVYGEGGDDVLLGEGWKLDVTSLEMLLIDMLDLDFSLAAGLVPADGDGDVIVGGDGADLLLGGAGDDSLDSGPGKAIIFGDSLTLNSSVQVNLDDLAFGAGIDFLRSGAGADSIVAGDDDALVMGGGGIDTIQGNSKGLGLLFGNGGDDTIESPAPFSLLVGGDGHDTLTGNGILIGDSFEFSKFKFSSIKELEQGKLSVGIEFESDGIGDDTIQGGNGNDFIIGGEGSDQIKGGDGRNIVFTGGLTFGLSIGFDFNDLFSIPSLIDVFFLPLQLLSLISFHFDTFGVGNDTYHGGNGIDAVFGSDGNDKIYGHGGIDFLVGGEVMTKSMWMTKIRNRARTLASAASVTMFSPAVQAPTGWNPKRATISFMDCRATMKYTAAPTLIRFTADLETTNSTVKTETISSMAKRGMTKSSAALARISWMADLVATSLFRI